MSFVETAPSIFVSNASHVESFPSEVTLTCSPPGSLNTADMGCATPAIESPTSSSLMLITLLLLPTSSPTLQPCPPSAHPRRTGETEPTPKPRSPACSPGPRGSPLAVRRVGPDGHRDGETVLPLDASPHFAVGNLEHDSTSFLAELTHEHQRVARLAPSLAPDGLRLLVLTCPTEHGVHVVVPSTVALFALERVRVVKLLASVLGAGDRANSLARGAPNGLLLHHRLFHLANLAVAVASPTLDRDDALVGERDVFGLGPEARRTRSGAAGFGRREGAARRGRR